MNVGDLVRCIWQPEFSGHWDRDGDAILMKHTIKNEFGLIIGRQGLRYGIMFPQLNGYIHWLFANAFEVINEAG